LTVAILLSAQDLALRTTGLIDSVDNVLDKLAPSEHVLLPEA
jgi:hypothetical protein